MGGSTEPELGLVERIIHDDIGSRTLNVAQDARHELPIATAKIERVADPRLVLCGNCLTVAEDPNATPQAPAHSQVSLDPAFGSSVSHGDANSSTQVILGIPGNEELMNPTLRPPVVATPGSLGHCHFHGDDFPGGWSNRKSFWQFGSAGTSPARASGGRAGETH
jgi:hypothetical protein